MICLRLYITDPPCRPDATLLVSRRADLSPRPATHVKFMVDKPYVTYSDLQGDCRSKVMVPNEKDIISVPIYQ